MYQCPICILIHVNADCTLGRWYIGMLQKMQHLNVTMYQQLHNVKIVYIMNVFSVDIPMSQCTIGRRYITKNALLYHIKLARNLCNSILYTKYLERHLYRLNKILNDIHIYVAINSSCIYMLYIMLDIYYIYII